MKVQVCLSPPLTLLLLTHTATANQAQVSATVAHLLFAGLCTVTPHFFNIVTLSHFISASHIPVDVNVHVMKMSHDNNYSLFFLSCYDVVKCIVWIKGLRFSALLQVRKLFSCVLMTGTRGWRAGLPAANVPLLISTSSHLIWRDDWQRISFSVRKTVSRNTPTFFIHHL